MRIIQPEVISQLNHSFPEKPNVTSHYIELPTTKLHYLKCGSGPPLIILPATVSTLENWVGLAEFMGLKFTVHFFELPGHGESTPFPESFRTDLVAEMVRDLIDELGYEKVGLMGFSFGGILAFKTLFNLRDRVDTIILLAPACDKKAIKYSSFQRAGVQLIVNIFSIRFVQKLFLKLIKNKYASKILSTIIWKITGADKTIIPSETFNKLSEKTLEVLTNQFQEILDFEATPGHFSFSVPCYFAMSVNDTMLEYESIKNNINDNFSNVISAKFYHPYHQLPGKPTFEKMWRDYSTLLDLVH